MEVGAQDEEEEAVVASGSGAPTPADPEPGSLQPVQHRGLASSVGVRDILGNFKQRFFES